MSKSYHPLGVDPSRTGTLRKQFELDLRKRFARVTREVRELIVEEDALGLKPIAPVPFIGLRELDHITKVRNQLGELVINQRWKFLTNAHKVAQFNQWLTETLGQAILTSQEVDAYWERYVQEGYAKGAGRAFDDTRGPNKFLSKSRLDFYAGSKGEFLRSSFGQPETIEKTKLLAGRVLTDLKGVTEDMAARLSRTLTDGLVQGQNPLTIARKLVVDLDFGRKRAQTIARTEIIRAHAEGQLDALEKLGVTHIGVMVEWSTAEDERVCPLCKPMEGVVLKTSESHGLLPRHPNCLVGATRVHAPGLISVMGAHYTGQIIDLVLADGRWISVTGHHVLLTQRGWSFAKDLSQSDYLIDGSSHTGSQTPNEYLSKPTIADIFESFVEVGEKCLVLDSVPTAENFHGDGKFIESKIRIVTADSKLRNYIQSLSAGLSVESPFSRRNIPALQALVLDSGGLLTSFFKRTGATADSLVRCSGIADILLARSLTHHQSVGLADSSDIDSLFREYPSNRSRTQSYSFSDSSVGPSLLIKLQDQINGCLVGIKSVSFRHVENLPVYDMSTETTLYLANGAVSSNCRCAFLPANVGEPLADQKRTKPKVDAAISKSIAAERPKGKRRSVAEQRRLSKWAGADVTVSKSRPTPSVTPRGSTAATVARIKPPAGKARKAPPKKPGKAKAKPAPKAKPARKPATKPKVYGPILTLDLTPRKR